MCFWKDNTKRGKFKWGRQSGITKTLGTGPNGDHTTSNTTNDGKIRMTFFITRLTTTVTQYPCTDPV